MVYKASLDTLAKVLTISVTAVFAAVIIFQLFILREEAVMSIFTIVVLLLIYFGAFVYRPISYQFTKDRLIIHRTFKDVIVKRNEIESIEQLDKKKLSGTIRTFGVGGLFGYFGRFSNRSMGGMIWYATRRSDGVMVKTIYNEKIIITPDQPEAFITAFNS